MSLFDDITGWKQKAAIVAGIVAIVGFLALVSLFFHYKDEAAKVPGLIQANQDLAAQKKRDDEIITGLNTTLGGLRAENTKLQGEVDADIKTNPAAYSCIVPAVSVRAINSAIAASAR